MKIFTIEYYVDAVEDHIRATVMAPNEEAAIEALKNDHSLDCYGFEVKEEALLEDVSIVSKETLN